MAAQDTETDKAAQAAKELKGVHQRLRALVPKVRDQSDKTTAAALEAEVEKLGAAVAAVSGEAPAEKRDAANEVVWPRDMSTDAGDPAWGKDPEALSHG